MVNGRTKEIGAARHRRIARAFGILGTILLMGFFLCRDALPADASLGESLDDSLWFIATPAILMAMYPSFLAGLIEGVPKEPVSLWSNTLGKRHSWTLIAVGALFCAASVLGHMLFDWEAAQLGGLAGLMRSAALPISGALLIGWAWTRPDWLFLDDDQQTSPDPMPTTTQ